MAVNSSLGSKKLDITKVLNSVFLKEIKAKLSVYMGLCVVDILAKKKEAET